ncbi:heterokaryon incompatibility protein-domain-containing protein [Apiosordaria backusii]|uniref:Heterokaryon incompatibility protein-domain-containing protein n=1 Tax=Apiosordaria backusii TaxID=314023 RepID=A0AA40BM40_9PEZI|nr:heterokaryon incompatibility protein-domain-containing protein [Apiosordaria backusii]
MSTRYEYPYLETGHIRLLHIISVSPEIRVRIDVVPLDANPAPIYVALSYVWGDKKPFSRVIIEPHDQYVNIARNLTLCFQHLDSFVGTNIWIDAVCINQEDDEEKSRQVSRMTSVYERATMVLSWLGPSADGSDAAMDGISSYGKAAVDAGFLNIHKDLIGTWPDVGDNPVHMRARDAVLELMVKANEAEGDANRAAERFPRLAFAAITRRNYFNRVWIKQEITLARNSIVVCGYKQTDAESFHAALLFYGLLTVWETNEYRAGRHTRIPGPFSEEELMAAPDGPWMLLKQTTTDPAVGSAFSGRRKFLREGGRQPLFELLHTSYVRAGALGLQSFDPRDKIYALLGIAADAVESGIYTDYTVAPDEAFEQAARFLVAKGHVDILKWCRSRRVRPPTWVPDFAANLSYTWSDDMGVPIFKATGSTTQPTDLVQNMKGPRPASIRLQGVRLDTVAAVRSVFVHNDGMKYPQAAAIQMFAQIEEFLQRTTKYTKDQWDDALWRIPICDREYHPTSMYFQRATLERSGRQFELLRTQPLDDGDVMAETMSYQATMQYADGARPIYLAEGYVGLGPRETVSEDIVVLLYGGSTPFVLRPAGVRGEYHLVGEAYIYGVMDGEMMDKGVNEEVFTLC